MPQEMRSLNQDWLYIAGDQSPEMGRDFATLGAEKVNIPHCWNGESAVDPDRDGYEQSIGWYQKRFTIPAEMVGQRIFLYFEGVSGISTIHVNGHLVGSHLGGYTGFTFEVTEWIIRGENILIVEADSRENKDLVPSRISDFYVYGGISRNVWLYGTGPIRLKKPQVRGENVSQMLAELTVGLEIEGKLPLANPAPLELTVELIQPDGKLVVSYVEQIGESGPINCHFQVVEPILWSPTDPQLYKVKMILRQGENIFDQYEVETGFRWFTFRQYDAFELNGERLLLRGTHIHEDAPLVGNALTDEEHVAELELVKSAGFNFVRLGHYPQSQAVMQACDRLGLLVWCELPWCRGGVGGTEFRNNTKQMLREMIAENYNHPSIIIWGLGNEFVENIANPDHVLDNPVDEGVISLVQELHDLAYELDGTRVTAIRKYEPASGIVDVYSPTIWAGWYRFEPYEEYGSLIEEYREKYPSFFHMEYGGGGLRGRYCEDWREKQAGWERGVEGDFNMNYVNELFEWHIITLESTPWVTGAAQWAFKDFATPLRPENDIPYVNMKGLVDRAGQPKDPYYIYKSYWGTEPVLFIESHDWKYRWGQPGEVKQVKVYSNCTEVELFLNGQSQGMRQRVMGQFPAAGLTWQVKFTEGENELKAVGTYRDEKGESLTMVDEHTLTYVTSQWGEPVAVEFEVEPISIPKLGQVYEIRATLVDKTGLRCFDADHRIRFSHTGSGQLLANLGIVEGSKLVGLACGQGRIRLLPGDEVGLAKIIVQLEGLEIIGEAEFEVGGGNIEETCSCSGQ